MTEPAISARNISVVFQRLGGSPRRRRREGADSVTALRDVSFDVRAGEAFGIIGANGAGKSTLMRVISQTLLPDAGTLTVRGATSTLLQLGVGFNPQLDGSRNIVLGCLAAGLSMEQVDRLHDEIWAYSELGDALFRPLSTYSRGMQSRLAFAIATYLDADILLVDEVLAVGDEAFKQKSLRTMHDLLNRSGTIVMVSHALGTVQEFCDRVMWLDRGEIQQIGDPATVIQAYREKHTIDDVRLLRETRDHTIETYRPLEIRRAEPLRPDALRSARDGTPAPAHHDVKPGGRADRATKRARKLVDAGWRRSPGDHVSLVPPVTWPSGGAGDAALHAWEPVGTLLAAFAQSPDRGWLQAATAIAVDWCERFASPTPGPEWGPGVTGLRAHRLGSLIDHVARDPLASDAHLKTLTVSAQIHAWALSDDERFTPHEIAGLHQVGGLMQLVQRVPELPDAEALGDEADRRLDQILASSFSRDGIHVDHTPTFHAEMVEALTALIDAGLISDTRRIRRRNRAEKALAWFVLPDGTVANFGEAGAPDPVSDYLAGDDKPRVGRIKRRWRTGPMRAAASAGHAGRTPDERVRVFAEGGYAVARNHWPTTPRQPDAAYLGLMAARHSTRRKHADDLSIIWWDRGRPVLVDAGGYLSERDDPLRRYVTSARGHNTIEIDGAHHFPGEPFGSGATHAGQTGDWSYVAGSALFGDLVYRRLAMTSPGRWLLVLDLLRDRADQPHSYAQWFHAAPDLSAVHDDGLVRLDGDDLSIHVSSIDGHPLTSPQRGALDPAPHGWVAAGPTVLEPAWAFGYEHPSDPRATFATVLSLVGPCRSGSVTSGGGANRADVAFVLGEGPERETVELAVDLREAIPVHTG